MGWWADRKKKREEKKMAKLEAQKKASETATSSKPAATDSKRSVATKENPVGLPAADLGPLMPGAPKNGKINFAVYCAAGCGGCDVSVLDISTRILTVKDMVDLSMWPMVMDAKEADVAAMDDGEITVSLINGAIRNSENEHMARLLRQKSTIVVAYGVCATSGGVPGLANLVPGGLDEIMEYVHEETPSSATFQQAYHKDSPVHPQASTTVPEGELTIPTLYETVYAMDQVIDVDYYIPGCPPNQESISHLLKAVIDFAYEGAALPPKGTIIGVTSKTLCEECPREKKFDRITEVKEPYEVDTDNNKCLVDMGILCLGASTMGGCGAACPRVGQPCRGCYGPSPDVQELGSSAFSAIASLFPITDDEAYMNEDDIDDIMTQIKDPLGYFYAFSVAKSLINKAVKEGGQ
ncbi:MAG TPA: oxidoreductase [Candidatus Methanomethylophilaceae archaeon]|nr:oxidoreductase [Candidatus Methanomethylophilaceae archaeon]